MAPKKPDINQYSKWMESELSFNHLMTKEKMYYERVSIDIRNQFENSEYWKALTNNLSNYYDEYESIVHYPLFYNRINVPYLLIKDYKSFVEKTYRKNIVSNNNWPSPPNGGWITPENWFSRINDIVRTKIVVNYIDGLDFLLLKMKLLATNVSLKIMDNKMNTPEGYYGVNTYLEGLEVNIPSRSIEIQNPIRIRIEIQLTTQFQDMMRGLLHPVYEESRIMPKIDEDWEWKYNSDKFSTIYLARILHYSEGMIMNIREKGPDKEQL
jgi:ppGpp synthetase/RelA/SpoT-type nucleotidyltranferase